ncbi:hypothetical protein GCM10018987_48090 [Streptomyces cremeus]
MTGRRPAAGSGRCGRSWARRATRGTAAWPRTTWPTPRTPPRDRLLWDLRALAAADGRDGGRGGRRPPAELRGFHPRLHLDLAADYLELGRPEAARVHLRRARALAEALGERERPALGVREAIGRLEARLAGP